MFGKSYRWCYNDCGKKVLFTLQDYGNTEKRLYKCVVCNQFYILKGRNFIKVDAPR